MPAWLALASYIPTLYCEERAPWVVAAPSIMIPGKNVEQIRT